MGHVEFCHPYVGFIFNRIVWTRKTGKSSFNDIVIASFASFVKTMPTHPLIVVEDPSYGAIHFVPTIYAIAASSASPGCRVMACTALGVIVMISKEL